MQIQPFSNKPLIKNKLFLGVLICGILSLIVSACLFIDIVVHLDSCIAWNACTEQSSGYYSFCVKDGYKYCCGGWGSDRQSCGSYYNNCRKKNDGFIDCGPVFTAQAVMNIIALICAGALIVIAIIHRRNQQGYQQHENISLNSQPELNYNRAQ